MANTNLTIDMITREALRILHNNIVFAKKVTKRYDSSFAQEGAKIGDTLRVRLPNQYTVTDGATLAVQDTVTQKVDVPVDTQQHVAMNFTAEELTLDIQDFSANIIAPAMNLLASRVDFRGLTEYQNISNQVGTPGTTPATALVWLQAGAKMDEFATPRDNLRNIVMDPQAQASTVDGLKGLFQDSGRIADQYRNGVMGRGLGFNFAMDQNVNKHTTGTFAGTTLVDDTVASGDAVITIDAFTAAAPAIKAGDVFTIAGVNAVNPETKEDTGSLQQFVVTADATGASNEVTVSVSPSFITTDTARKTVTALPADGAAVTWAGTESTVYPINMAYHPEAFVLASADLEMPQGVAMASRQVFDGVSMRIVKQYDINNDKTPTRVDILYGWSTVRASMACRVIG